MTHALTRRLVLAGLSSTFPLLAGCRPTASKFDADVIVLGAGLSGLHAARLLEEAGRDVLMLEGSSRIGGRLHTLELSNGQYSEGGGEQVGANYARILHAADQVGVAFSPDSLPPPETAYLINGEALMTSDFAEATPDIYPPSLGSASPAGWFFRTAAKANPLKTPSDWRDPQFAAFDISALEFTAANGLGDAGAILVDHTLNANSLSTYSMLNLYRSLHLFSHSRGMGPSLSIDGGAQRLPEAMAASLSRPVETGQMVTAITSGEHAVDIETASGKTWRARHVICALPFGALRRVKLQAPVSQTQKQAIQDLPYTQILQIHFEAEAPFWELDGLPANMWSDGPLERIFVGRGKDGTPNGMCRAWINGTGANNLHKLGDSELAELASKEMAVLRPQSEGKINVRAVQRWTDTNPLAGGAYMHWAPGQIGNWAEAMGKPAGRIRFCGEHLSYLHTGMEGAMESAEYAAFDLLES